MDGSSVGVISELFRDISGLLELSEVRAVSGVVVAGTAGAAAEAWGKLSGLLWGGSGRLEPSVDVLATFKMVLIWSMSEDRSSILLPSVKRSDDKSGCAGWQGGRQ